MGGPHPPLPPPVLPSAFVHRLTRRVLRAFGWAERPAAWLLLVGGAVTFVGVVANLIATGDAKTATLLVAADLVVSGFGAVQQAEEEDG